MYLRTNPIDSKNGEKMNKNFEFYKTYFDLLSKNQVIYTFL